jgi:hypothetical protein
MIDFGIDRVGLEIHFEAIPPGLQRFIILLSASGLFRI